MASAKSYGELFFPQGRMLGKINIAMGKKMVETEESSYVSPRQRNKRDQTNLPHELLTAV